MQFKTQLLVLGAKCSKGEFNGKPYDSTTVYYQADLQQGENFVGQVGQEIRFGTSENFQKMKGLKYPIMCEALMEQVSNGKTTSLIIKDLAPLVPKA